MFRKHNDIREVDVEVVSPADQTPFVVQLLSTGELPGVDAKRAPLVEVEPVAPLEEPEPPVEFASPVEADAVSPLEEPEPAIKLARAVQVERVVPLGQHEAAGEFEPDERPAVATAPAKPKRGRTKRPAPQRVASSAHPAEETVTPEPEAATGEDMTCDIVFWRGYRKATFYARIFSDDGEPLAVAHSPSFRVRGNGIPEKTDEAVAAYQALREQLEQTGWDRVADGNAWFADVYSRPL
jgi:hypothetical protein